MEVQEIYWKEVDALLTVENLEPDTYHLFRLFLDTDKYK